MSSVDIIVPCYRYGRFLQECVQSVILQEGPDVRVLIIDDCSPDNTPEVSRSLEISDSRVSYVRHARNQGHIATYNEGIEWASGDYMLLLSADDYLLPGALQRAITLMEANLDVVFTFGNALCRDEKGQTKTTEVQKYYCDFPVIAGFDFIKASAARNLVPTPTAVVRTHVQRRVGGYRSDLPHSGDMEMWYRLAAHGSVGILTEHQAVYRRHSSNMSLNYMSDTFLPDVQQRKLALDVFFSCWSYLLPRSEAVRSELEHALALDALGFASQAFDSQKNDDSERLYQTAVAIAPRVRYSLPAAKLRLKRWLRPRTVQTIRRVIRGTRKGQAQSDERLTQRSKEMTRSSESKKTSTVDNNLLTLRSSDPVVSVVMSVFNGEKFLAEAIDSILNQSWGDFEFIIIDDGSKDNSARIIDTYAKQDARIRSYHQQNVGLIDSLNRGCTLARGKYIARMDADDIACHNRLALQVDFLERHERTGVVGGQVHYIDRTGRILGTAHLPTTNSEIQSELRSNSVLVHPTVLMRRVALLGAGGYRKAFVAAEDYDLWLRIADTWELANLGRITLKYRHHSDKVSVSRCKQQALSTLGAQVSASARRSGKPDRLNDSLVITSEGLRSIGVSAHTENAAICRTYLGRIRSMYAAREYCTAAELTRDIFGRGELSDAERWVRADLYLVSACIAWQQRKFCQAVADATFALVARPAIVIRPFGGTLRSIRKAFGARFSVATAPTR